MINYFNFKKFNDEYLLTNDLGRYIFISPEQLKEMLINSSVSDEKIQRRLTKNAFIYDTNEGVFLNEYQHHMRNAKRFMFSPTQLHIFVVTTACNMQCVYCQAQNGSTIPHEMMTEEIAHKAVDIALQSPTDNLQFEFQGGEPLINYDVIKYIIEYANAHSCGKIINYSIATNMTLITDEMLDFFEANHVSISTSLDGDEILHNINRPFKNGKSTYSAVKDAIEVVRNRNVPIGALMTTTKSSLQHPKELIDEYVARGFETVTLRSLTPLGRANKSWDTIGYTAEEFLEFYSKAFDYIIDINLKGKYLSEGIASILLKKIIEGISMNYMELRSPCGASIGQVAYYADGNIYTCDEGRMLAEMGNGSFKLGNVFLSDYNSLMDSRVCKSVCAASVVECLPSCADCVYQPYCGVCPAVNYALYGDLLEKTPNGYKCKINKGILDIIFTKLQEDDYNVRQVFRSWIE